VRVLTRRGSDVVGPSLDCRPLRCGLPGVGAGLLMGGMGAYQTAKCAEWQAADLVAARLCKDSFTSSVPTSFKSGRQKELSTWARRAFV